jgi:signal transduction histidine kinase
VTASRSESIPRRRRFGVRLWLSLAFASVGIVTGTSVYAFVSGSSEESVQERSTEIATGQTVQLAGQVRGRSLKSVRKAVAQARSESFAPWVFSARRKLRTPEVVLGVDLDDVDRRAEALRQALRGLGFVDDQGGGVTVVAAPVVRRGLPRGAVLAQATRPSEVQGALQAVREDRLKALAIAVGLAVLIGAIVASLITVRVKRLAAGAAELAEGRLDVPLESRGRDEISDLGSTLDGMRVRLRESFELLSTERDTLSTILEALGEAVMVVSKDGEIRFSNRAASPLIGPDGRPTEPLEPWLRRASEHGDARHHALRVGRRVYAVHARELAAEDAVLAVVRDRTEELRRQVAEREFVSNAAHELRNPIAGISSSIEVLLAGAKDDPEAREHFLARLAEDAERISRLTHSLLTLARIDAVGEAETDVVDVAIAAEEAIAAVLAPEWLRLSVEIEPGLSVHGDPALIRQVMISLLTNAYKNTPRGGTITLRARAESDGEAVIEVSDTGTGIPAEEQARIFERFYRGSNALEKEGFGLGLSIARRMVEVMGGKIGVLSELGTGSVFWVRLPVAKPAPTPVA